MSTDYYGDGQHTLHVDEATIEDDNGTFTCLAVNAAGRVQITADVFVHEKGKSSFSSSFHRTSIVVIFDTEVIDVPRKSPVILHSFQRKITDDHEPMISPPLSPFQTAKISENNEQKDAKRFIDRFRNDQTTKHFESKKNLEKISSLLTLIDVSLSICLTRKLISTF